MAPVLGGSVFALRSKAAVGVDLSTGRSDPTLNREVLGGFNDLMPNGRVVTLLRFIEWEARRNRGDCNSQPGRRGAMAEQDCLKGHFLNETDELVRIRDFYYAERTVSRAVSTHH